MATPIDRTSLLNGVYWLSTRFRIQHVCISPRVFVGGGDLHILGTCIVFVYHLYVLKFSSLTAVAQGLALFFYLKLEFHRGNRTHRAETRRYFNVRFFGPMPPDVSDLPGGVPALQCTGATDKLPTHCVDLYVYFSLGIQSTEIEKNAVPFHFHLDDEVGPVPLSYVTAN